MNPTEALAGVLRDLHAVTYEDADEIVDELNRLGFKIVSIDNTSPDPAMHTPHRAA